MNQAESKEVAVLKLSLRSPYNLDDPETRQLVRQAVQSCIRDIRVLNAKMLRHNLEASRKAGEHTDKSSFNISSAQKMQVFLSFGWDEETEVSHLCQLFDPAYLPRVEPIIMYHQEMLRAELTERASLRLKEALA